MLSVVTDNNYLMRIVQRVQRDENPTFGTQQISLFIKYEWNNRKDKSLLFIAKNTVYKTTV